MDVLAGRWTVVVLARLGEHELRFAELGRLIPGISEKMLAERLRKLVNEGIVERRQVSDAPPHVLYKLSDDGRSLVAALQGLHDWGAAWASVRGYEIAPGDRRPV